MIVKKNSRFSKIGLRDETISEIRGKKRVKNTFLSKFRRCSQLWMSNLLRMRVQSVEYVSSVVGWLIDEPTRMTDQNENIHREWERNDNDWNRDRKWMRTRGHHTELDDGKIIVIWLWRVWFEFRYLKLV